MKTKLTLKKVTVRSLRTKTLLRTGASGSAGCPDGGGGGGNSIAPSDGCQDGAPSASGHTITRASANTCICN